MNEDISSKLKSLILTCHNPKTQSTNERPSNFRMSKIKYLCNLYKARPFKNWSVLIKRIKGGNARYDEWSNSQSVNRNEVLSEERQQSSINRFGSNNNQNECQNHTHVDDRMQQQQQRVAIPCQHSNQSSEDSVNRSFNQVYEPEQSDSSYGLYSIGESSDSNHIESSCGSVSIHAPPSSPNWSGTSPRLLTRSSSDCSCDSTASSSNVRSRSPANSEETCRERSPSPPMPSYDPSSIPAYNPSTQSWSLRRGSRSPSQSNPNSSSFNWYMARPAHSEQASNSLSHSDQASNSLSHSDQASNSLLHSDQASSSLNYYLENPADYGQGSPGLTSLSLRTRNPYSSSTESSSENINHCNCNNRQ